MTALTVLDLPGNRLVGRIPTELLNLNALTSLDLAVNDLNALEGRGALSELVLLTKVQVLNVSRSGLSGTIPTAIGALVDLEGLFLNDDPLLAGAIPTELGLCSTLWVLNVSNTGVSGTILTEMGQLTALEVAHLSTNRLSGTIPTELASLPVLEELWLDGNDIEGSVPSEVCAMMSRTTNCTEQHLTTTWSMTPPCSSQCAIRHRRCECWRSIAAASGVTARATARAVRVTARRRSCSRRRTDAILNLLSYV